MRIDRVALTAALAEGATVITPNRRLARALKNEFDLAQWTAAEAAGRAPVWAGADVLPWDAWLERSTQELRTQAGNGAVPDLLNPLQQQVLWEQIVGESAALPPLGRPAALAQTASEAWELLQQYGEAGALARVPLNEDHEAFHGWVREFARRLRQRHAISAAQLADYLAQAARAGRWRPAATCVLAGFDVLTPAQQRLQQAIAASGAAISLAPRLAAEAVAVAQRVACADPRSQWDAVAAWAQARLQAAPQARIGIVVPDLGAQREAIVAALTDALAPALRWLPHGRDRAAAQAPFNLSLGAPLAEAPMVASALALFDLLVAPQPIDRVGHLLRSPFLAGGAAGEVEWGRRARLDRYLREASRWQLDLDALRRAAGALDDHGTPRGDSAPQLAAALSRVERRVAAPRGRRQPLSAWISLLFEVQREVGLPGSRSLDSIEYQTWQRWRELMMSLGTLDALVGGVTLADAVARLRSAAAEALFQPQADADSGEAPVQVLGVLESTQLDFDHLWVANLSDDRWPPPSTPNPLLPLALQRAWQMPGASPALAWARAQRQMAGWGAQARELVYSYALRDGDRPAQPSPLIAAFPLMPPPAALRPVAARAGRGLALEARVDEQAPPLSLHADAQRGGSGVFTDQSACGFRAFALHRLHARPLEAPQPGLDASARGRLLHAALEAFWQDLGSQAALRALDDSALYARLLASAEVALAELARHDVERLTPRLRALERERLVRAVNDWLQIEDARPPFTVLTVEEQAEITLGGLRVAVRPDRVDRLDDGSLVIIDYKTGRVSTGDWLEARPDAPQLPLYATAYASGALAGGAQRVAALAYGRIAAGDTRAEAVADRDGLFERARVIGATDVAIARPGWDGLMADWTEALHALAAEFTGGTAPVAPKSLQACTSCPLPLLCRVGERATARARVEAQDAAAESRDD